MSEVYQQKQKVVVVGVVSVEENRIVSNMSLLVEAVGSCHTGYNTVNDNKSVGVCIVCDETKQYKRV